MAWPRREMEYAEQACLAARQTLLVNSISRNPTSHGGAFYFFNGKIEKKLAYDMEDVLMIEV